MHKQSELTVYKLVETGQLEIDQEGRVWRVKRRTSRAAAKPCRKVRAELMTSDGYLQVRAMISGVRHCAAAARLVWLHFHGPIPQGMTVNHIDGVKKNNRPPNLELATYSDQRIHAVRVLGARHHNVQGSRNPKTTLTEEDVISIRQLRTAGWMVKAIAKRFGITPNAASQICLGTTWKHVTPSSFG